MKNIGLCVMVSLIASGAVAGGPSWSLSSEGKSAYLIGQSVKLSDAAWSNSLLASWKDGTSIEVWYQLPFEAAGLSSESFGNEFDFTFGTPMKHFGLPGRIELATYQLAPLDRFNHEFLTVSWSVPVGPLSFCAQRMEGVGSERFASGWFFKVDAAPSASHGRFTFTLPLRLTYDTGVGGKDPGFLGRAKPEVAFRLNPAASIYAGWEADVPLSGQANRQWQHASRAGLRYKF